MQFCVIQQGSTWKPTLHFEYLNFVLISLFFTKQSTILVFLLRASVQCVMYQLLVEVLGFLHVVKATFPPSFRSVTNASSSYGVTSSCNHSCLLEIVFVIMEMIGSPQYHLWHLLKWKTLGCTESVISWLSSGSHVHGLWSVRANWAARASCYQPVAQDWRNSIVMVYIKKMSNLYSTSYPHAPSPFFPPKFSVIYLF